VTGTRLEVGLLGPLQVSVAGRPVELPGGRLPALLAALALSAGQTVSVDRLATAVWGEDLSVDARANVQSNVRRLRRLLGAELVATRGAGYALEVQPDRVDALRFVRLLDLAATAPDRTTQRDLLVEALGLWRGTPFDGVRSDWLEQTQAPWLLERYLAGLERRIDLDLADGTQVDLAAELGELTGRYPLRESLWVRLLVVLERSGRPAEALERYEAIRVRLAEELGADPGAELQRVHADLLAGRASAAAASAPPAPDPPGHPFGVPQTPPAHQMVPRQLPADTDAFTGREAALKALDGLLGDPDESTPRPVAIAAIAGTAGIGKTALAVHWAHRVADRFPDGQLYVNLRGFDPSWSPVGPAEAVRGFLDALRVPPQQVPLGLEAQAGLYRSLLAGRRMLVLLDNARDADQVAPLLPGAPGCLVLVTSRNQLAGLVVAAGAHPLALDLLGRDEAVRLLARRLGDDRINAEPDATDELVTRCAGLPLALAIVAARAATHPEFPLAALADQLRVARDGLDGSTAGTPPLTCGRCSPGLITASARRRRGCSGCWGSTPVPTSAPAPRPASPASRARRRGRCLPSWPARTWSCLGDTHHHLGDQPQAIACYRQALALFRELGDRYGEAGILAHLGELHRGAGDPDAARDAWREARAVLGELDQPASDRIRTRLYRFDQPAAAEALFRP
jgi:DNA-binding SARP family transcriptional activator